MEGLQQRKTQLEKEKQKKLQSLESQLMELQQRKSQFEKEQQKIIQQKKKEISRLQQEDIRQIPPPTDQEFDAWLENRVKECLDNTIAKFGLKNKNPRELLRVRGYVLPGMRDADHYRPQDLHHRQGADGKRRSSINLYTFFWPDDDRIIVLTYDINAMNWEDYRDTMREYFYQDIIGVTVENDHDTLYMDGKIHKYRTQRFSLRLCDGTAVSATVRSRPLEIDANLPSFEIPQYVDDTILQLRMYLRRKGELYPHLQ